MHFHQDKFGTTHIHKGKTSTIQFCLFHPRDFSARAILSSHSPVDRAFGGSSPYSPKVKSPASCASNQRLVPLCGTHRYRYIQLDQVACSRARRHQWTSPGLQPTASTKCFTQVAQFMVFLLSIAQGFRSLHSPDKQMFNTDAVHAWLCCQSRLGEHNVVECHSHTCLWA